MVVQPIADSGYITRREIGTATVRAGPPAETLVPAIEKAEGFGVKDWPATVNTPVAVGVDDSVGSEMVELPIPVKGDISGRDITKVPPTDLCPR